MMHIIAVKKTKEKENEVEMVISLGTQSLQGCLLKDSLGGEWKAYEGIA